MKLKDISNLIIKIAGMIIIVISISDISYLVGSYSQYQNHSFGTFFYAVILPSVMPILLGLMMFKIPNTITNSIVKCGDFADEEKSTFTLLHLEQVALTTLGIFLLYKALTDSAYHIINFAQAMAGFPSGMEKPSKSLIFSPDFLATFVELILSVWLIFNTKNIAKLMKYLRSE